MKLKYVAIISIALIFMTVSAYVYFPVNAQAGIRTECGAIPRNTFSSNYEEHVYVLNLKENESVTASVKRTGTQLISRLTILGPTDLEVGRTGMDNAPSINSDKLSADGTYKIVVNNSYSTNTGGPGSYQLYIGCETAQGIVQPGDNPAPTATPAPVPTATPRSALPEKIPTFDGIGFPGIAPVDMSQVVRVPLPLEASPYGIAPLDNQIFGFLVDAEADDVLDLTYTRTTGNMNLGLVVLSENNEVFFQASLVTSESLSTRLPLPEAGEYTIGVFRISLVEPSELEPTVFQISGELTSAE